MCDEPSACGTGKKYKHYCLPKDEQAERAAREFLTSISTSPRYIYITSMMSSREFSMSRIVIENPTPTTILPRMTYLGVLKVTAPVVDEMRPKTVEYRYVGGPRGWKGDVPVVRFNLAKVRRADWHATRSSAEATRTAIRSMLDQASVD